jgi:hypothetical protein
VAMMMHREFAFIVGFCAVGLLMTACFIHSFPSFGEMAAALDLTP